MKKIIPTTLLLALTLVACSTNVLQYDLKYNVQDTNRQAALASAAARVIERRLSNLEQVPEQGNVVVQGNRLTIKPKDTETADALREQLMQPFSISLMVETDAAHADITNEKYGSFKETGIKEAQFDSVELKTGNGAGTSSAAVFFTPEGKAMLTKVFRENQGKAIGIFVRGTLMSKRVIDASNITQENITIDGIPTAELASAFTDDVNVGLHVNFTEVK
jgi:Tfp pilus assembly protein PilX